mgnify:CR=1 FL=1
MKRLPLYPALLALLGLWIFGCSGESNTPKTEATPSAITDSARAASRKDSVLVELIGRDSVTVFDLLKESHRVDYLSTGGGVFVKGIDSVNNDPSTFWIYKVNDTTPKVAADRMSTRSGDRVVWHFRKMGE